MSNFSIYITFFYRLKYFSKENTEILAQYTDIQALQESVFQNNFVDDVNKRQVVWFISASH